jgi:hypothetical protein
MIIFVLMRNRYKKRVLEALHPENRGRYMSLIIDKMDSNHCRCPFLGTQVSFGDPLTIGITGVLEHGVGECMSVMISPT